MSIPKQLESLESVEILVADKPIRTILRMWKTDNRGRYAGSKQRYPSALTDEEKGLIKPLIPPAKRGGNTGVFFRRRNTIRGPAPPMAARIPTRTQRASCTNISPKAPPLLPSPRAISKRRGKSQRQTQKSHRLRYPRRATLQPDRRKRQTRNCVTRSCSLTNLNPPLLTGETDFSGGIGADLADGFD